MVVEHHHPPRPCDLELYLGGGGGGGAPPPSDLVLLGAIDRPLKLQTKNLVFVTSPDENFRRGVKN